MQHTISLVPRLPEPTLVTAVLVAANYDVRIIGQDVDASGEKVSKVKSELDYTKLQQERYQILAQQNAGPVEDAQKWLAQMRADEAGVKEASADAQRSRLRFDSQINGVNTIAAKAPPPG